MAYELWSQDVFSKGELSPYMYARATVTQYGDGLKIAQNVLTYPTGAAGKRFGTLYNATLTGFTSALQVYFQSFQYLNECTYQLVWAPGNTYIYLEGKLVATVSNAFIAEDCYNLSSTILTSIFRVSGAGFKPYDLTRASDAGKVVINFSPNSLQLASATTYANLVIPIQFTGAGGTIIQTVPQINQSVTYFAYFNTADTFVLYANPQDAAAFNDNYIRITNGGTGTTTAFTLNTWSLAHTTFTDLPFYDFTANYDAITFTPSAVVGAAVTLTASSAIFSAAYVGGAFFGAGGSARIIAYTDTTHVTISVQTPFDGTGAIQGSLALLAEPAWSDARGWPQKCASYQNRAIFCNTKSLPNGFWASVINDYANFGNLTNDDDDAISWFPSSNDINFIRFIVPYRSLTVHTNSGIYSSPLSDIAAITPSNFTLQLQDSTPADVLQPQAIDNQIVVLSGNDAHQMIWDGINNAYTSDIVSVPNEQTIRDPVDETAFADLRRAGSRYVFITNANGSLAVFQTLISQNVAGITPQIMEQSNGNAYFRQTCSSSDGRCWFMVERQIAVAATPIAISGYTPYVAGPPIVLSTLHAVSSNISTTLPTAVGFTTTGVLPVSSPQIDISHYYWALGTDANNFQVYLTQEDALAGVNSINFTSAGTTSNVIRWPLSTIFTLEELTTDTFLDCAVHYAPKLGIEVPTDTVTTGALFNTQNVKMIGDGFGFDAIGIANQVEFEAHGVDVDITEAYIGFPINMIIQPMPLTLANGPSAKNTTLTKPKHIRSVRFMFNNTIGGTINGVPIALNAFDMAHIGEPPFPSRGIFEMSVMKGWDDFNNPTYTIEHNEPFNIELLGVFYSVDI